jgi:hypothetical protein
MAAELAKTLELSLLLSTGFGILSCSGSLLQPEPTTEHLDF